jgi:DNA-binding winged helix-turn-helix (wHTH) protein
MWGERCVESGQLYSILSRLRKKIADVWPDLPPPLVTVPRVGARLDLLPGQLAIIEEDDDEQHNTEQPHRGSEGDFGACLPAAT